MLQSERQGNTAEPMTRMYPPITGGVCDFCGVVNNLLPSEVQYLQPHVPNCPYSMRGGIGQLMCTYCPPQANHSDVIKNRKIQVHDSPFNPTQIIAVCDSLQCSAAHEKRFKLNK